MTQHFQPIAASTFACGADAVGRRNSRLDPDPNATTCAKCRNTLGWQTAMDAYREGVANETLDRSAREVQIDRFGAARALTMDIPDSQYVALVEGKVRMGLSTYEALAKAAAKPDDQSSPQPELDALFGKHGRQGVRPPADDQSSPPADLVHYCTAGRLIARCGRWVTGPEVKLIVGEWTKVTCPDCLSYYKPEDDPAHPARPDLGYGTPRFEHDCDECVFLGSETVGGAWHDLYYHPGTHPTVIARESSDPGSYRSGLSFVHRDGALALAYIRAQRRGLL